MSIKTLKECLPTLKKLANAKTKKERIAILRKARNCVYYAISDISSNTLKGNFPLSTKERKVLKKFRNPLRRLGDKTTLKKRKFIINQQGGAFFSALLIPALSILSQIVADKLLSSK